MGKEFGVNDSGYSIDAVFFDYDKDGDLDLYVCNHPKHQSGVTLDEHYQNWLKPIEEYSDRLYRNNNDGTFSDVTKEAGVFNYGSTLSASVSDFNNDGWSDIYVSVDHNEPDVYYENNGDGTFSKQIKKRFQHTAFSAMGSDAADFNNDGLIDFISVDMLSEDNFRQKAQMGDMNPGLYWTNIERGYNHTIMRNQLHLNNGNGTFSEIAAMAGISKTDWSWAPLFVDFNNNGYKDLFVSNGYLLDILDKDFRKKALASLENAAGQNQNPVQLLLEKVDEMTSTKLRNYCFQNNGDLKFTDVSETSGLGFDGYSNGAAYGDLDQDGDMDLVVNNINEVAQIYENQANNNGNNYLIIELDGNKKIHTYGTRVFVESNLGTQVQELQPTRGYQSSMEEILHFGLANNQKASLVKVQWMDGSIEELRDVSSNQRLTLQYKDAVPERDNDRRNGYFVKSDEALINEWRHIENEFDDYEFQVLLPHKMSQFGPHISSADINGDGLTDLYIGGAKGQEGTLMMQKEDGKFYKIEQVAFNKDRRFEDLGSVFFDVDNDNDLDLYVVSGGNFATANNEIYMDRLYLNDGNGIFSRSTTSIPSITVSGSCVKPCDFDNDGDIDLFVGGRHVPHKYPFPESSFILSNENGVLKKHTTSNILENLGMVTDALWTDINDDKRPDLIIVGEWMPITVLVQEDEKFNNRTEEFNLDKTVGWWNAIKEGDFNGDGKKEYVLGNLGQNYKYKVDGKEDFHVYAHDFDNSGTVDIALGYFYDNEIYPVRGRQCSSEQVPVIAEKFPNYHSFAKANISDVYGEDLNNALHYQINTFSTSILKKGNTGWELEKLPNKAQIAPVNTLIVEDLNNDTIDDVIMAGNLFVSEVETGRADAGTGQILLGSKNENYTILGPSESGIYIPGDVKCLEYISDKYLFVANNDDKLEVFRRQNK